MQDADLEIAVAVVSDADTAVASATTLFNVPGSKNAAIGRDEFPDVMGAKCHGQSSSKERHGGRQNVSS